MQRTPHTHSPLADASLPAHIAIIMDGNGRWAQWQRVARARGHEKGAEALRQLLEACRTRPFIHHLTLYAFSMENWNRTDDEVNDLMSLLRHYVKREAKTLHANNVRLRFIGDLGRLAPDIQADLEAVRALTEGNTGLTVQLAISYGARQEIAEAASKLAAQVAAGTLAPEAITPETLAAALYTHPTPDPDLLIRTGGDERLSNFLLWQAAYAELYFTDTLWPDFTPADLDAAIQSYSQRERRFGARKADAS